MENQVQGLGLNYLPRFAGETSELLKHFQFMEVAPEGLFYGRDPSTQQAIANISQKIPVTFHSRSLSFASMGAALDQHYLNQIRSAIREFRPACYSDHLSYTRSEKSNLPIYLPPIPFAKHLDALIARSFELSNFFGQPVHLENVADFMVSRMGLAKSLDFMKTFFAESPSRLILNLNSVIITAFLLGLKTEDLLRRFPLSQVQSVTLLLPQSQNVVLARNYAGLVTREMGAAVEFLFKNSSTRSLLLQRFHATDTWNNIQGQVEVIARKVS